MCAKMGISTAYYYREYKKKYIEKDIEVKRKMSDLQRIHHNNLGREKMHMLLVRNKYVISMYKVSKLLKELNMNCRLRYKRFRLPKGDENIICKNLLNREFKPMGMYEKIVTDVTEFKIGKGKIYLSIVLDLYNNEILGYEMSNKPTFNFIYQSIKNALIKIPNEKLAGMIFHSDQGWAYTMKQLQIELKELGIKQSMSRKGNCYDNAVIESIFGHIKSETFYKNMRKMKKEEFEIAMSGYIYYYNNVRVQTKLKGYAPIEVRT